MLHAPNLLRRRSIHSQRLERWLGPGRIEELARTFRHGGGEGHAWYGPPAPILDVPGDVSVTGDGDFIGQFDRGFFASAADHLADHFRALWRAAGRPIYIPGPVVGAGFPGYADLIARIKNGSTQSHRVIKALTSGANVCGSDGYLLGTVPAADLAGAGAPGGSVRSSSSSGALKIVNPASGTMHLIGADLSSSLLNASAIIYDRLWEVVLLAASGNGSLITGAPTRYQSTTATDPDYVGGNFCFPGVATNLPSSAHVFTVTYTDQAGNTSNVSATVSGLAGLTAGGIDVQKGWFIPLASGDVGIKKLEQPAWSTLYSGAFSFAIGHLLGVVAFPVINQHLPAEWYRSRELAPRVFDDACLSILSPNTSAATTIDGLIHLSATDP